MKFLVINGANLNLLGIREPEIYGFATYGDLCKKVGEYATAKGIEVDFFQSNCEGKLVDAIQQAYSVYDGLILNPGGYTHTSVVIPDAVRAVGIPTVEVHLSDPDAREAFRKINYLRPACVATVKGKGFDGYLEALDILSGGKF